MNALCAVEAKRFPMSRRRMRTDAVQASRTALTSRPAYVNRRRLTRSMRPANTASAAMHSRVFAFAVNDST